MPGFGALIAVDLGKSRCRIATDDDAVRLDGVGAPGLAAASGVSAAFDAIAPLLARIDRPLRAVGVGAAGAWAAPEAASDLASRLAAETGARIAVTSDVVTAHIGAFGGGEGVLLIAGTGAVALGMTADGARLVDGWGPELGDLGSGSWLGRETLRAVLRASAGLAPDTVLTAEVASLVGTDITGWVAQSQPLARRLATLAPVVLDAAASGDRVAREIADEAVRLLTASAAAASSRIPDVVLHGGLSDHAWFRSALASSLDAAGCRVLPAVGGALDGALLLLHRSDLPHERFVHRAE